MSVSTQHAVHFFSQVNSLEREIKKGEEEKKREKQEKKKRRTATKTTATYTSSVSLLKIGPNLSDVKGTPCAYSRLFAATRV